MDSNTVKNLATKLPSFTHRLNLSKLEVTTLIYP